jgi:uncharacterized repeat protein (TIGR01451 family)
VVAQLSVDAHVATIGDVLAFRLGITNPGHLDAPVVVTVALPPHALLDAGSISASQGAASHVGNQLRWTVDLAPGAEVSLVWKSTVANDATHPGALETFASVAQEDMQVQESRISVLVDPVRTMLPAIGR